MHIRHSTAHKTPDGAPRVTSSHAGAVPAGGVATSTRESQLAPVVARGTRRRGHRRTAAGGSTRLAEQRWLPEGSVGCAHHAQCRAVKRYCRIAPVWLIDDTVRVALLLPKPIYTPLVTPRSHALSGTRLARSRGAGPERPESVSGARLTPVSRGAGPSNGEVAVPSHPPRCPTSPTPARTRPPPGCLTARPARRPAGFPSRGSRAHTGGPHVLLGVDQRAGTRPHQDLGDLRVG